MKPIKLVIEGINSFTDPQTLDFEAVGRSNLFCISGKTGAGKTTIFDSLMLALYGRSGKGNLADVVNLSRMSARVTLDFDEGGDRYTVERTIKCRAEKDSNGEKTDRRIATTDCMLYKNGAPLCKGADEASEVIRSIIGLEESEFKNVYLLEQGEYAEFLKKTPAKQTEAVGKIFSLMRFGDVNKLAGEKKRIAENDVDKLDKLIAELGDVTAEKLREETKALSAIKAKTTALLKTEAEARAELDKLSKTRDAYLTAREKQKHVRDLMLQSDEAKKKVYLTSTALTEFEKTLDPETGEKLGALREKLTALSSLNALDKEFSAAERDEQAKREGSIKKLQSLEAAQKEQGALADKRDADCAAYKAALNSFAFCARGQNVRSVALDRAIEVFSGEVSAAVLAEVTYALKEDKQGYDALVAQRTSLAEQADKAQKSCDSLLTVIEKLTKELDETTALKQATEQKEREAKAAYSAAQMHSHAAAVRAELNVGDTCPVCGGHYDGSFSGGDTDVEKRKAELASATAELSKITAREGECVKHLERAKDDYDRAAKEKARIDGESAAADKKIEESRVDPVLYGKLAVILKDARNACETAAKSVEKYAAQEPVIAALKAEEQAARLALAEAENKAKELKQKLGDNCGKTEEQMKAVQAEITALEKQTMETENRLKVLRGEADGAKAALGAIEKSLESAKAECPVDIPEFDEQGYNEKRDALDRINKTIAENNTVIAVKESELKTLAENCKRREDWLNERNGFRRHADILGDIAEITKGKAMLNYVAAEYIAEFTAVASEILNGLSGGKYTMRYDKQNGFTVSDYLNDGKSRKTDTLSGGELFLASLSVAIAIARTQSSGNNAFFFLDEGFGTLDEELIDTVYGALESLSKTCLVGVISHSNALIEKMPAQVEVLEATDTMGSIIKY